jgi:hypothetical protein
MSDEVSRSSEIEAALQLVAMRLAEVRQAIDTLQEAKPLRADAAARLEMYKHNEGRLLLERGTLEQERVELARGEDHGIASIASNVQS